VIAYVQRHLPFHEYVVRELLPTSPMDRVVRFAVRRLLIRLIRRHASGHRSGREGVKSKTLISMMHERGQHSAGWYGIVLTRYDLMVVSSWAL